MPRTKTSMPRQERRTTRAGQAPKLPHERDESNDTPAEPHREMRRAYGDVEKGLVDTDVRGAGSQALARRMNKTKTDK
jgi:hypothetical protein